MRYRSTLKVAVGAALPFSLLILSVAPAWTTVFHPGYEPGAIQEALWAAADSDTVLVRPGLYLDDIDFPARGIALMAEHPDPRATVLGSAHGSSLTIHRAPTGIQRVSGFTIRDRYQAVRIEADYPPVGELLFERVIFENNGPGGVLADHLGRVAFVDCSFNGNSNADLSPGGILRLHGVNKFERCVFEDNASSVGGSTGRGGLIVMGKSRAGYFETLTLRDCRFMRNHTLGAGGVLFTDVLSQIEITGCRFEDNSAGVAGGALYVGDANVEIHDNVFIGNKAPQASAVRLSGVGSQNFERNTIVAGSGQESEAVRVTSSIMTVRLYANIIAYSTGAAVSWGGGPGTQSCNDFYANAGGAVVGAPPAGMTNFELDPRFCDLKSRDLRLAADSPCLDSLPLCSVSGRVGALDSGCGPLPVRAVSWGRLKYMYSGH